MMWLFWPTTLFRLSMLQAFRGRLSSWIVISWAHKESSALSPVSSVAVSCPPHPQWEHPADPPCGNPHAPADRVAGQRRLLAELLWDLQGLEELRCHQGSGRRRLSP